MAKITTKKVAVIPMIKKTAMPRPSTAKDSPAAKSIIS
jgi:hypothetical protein